MSGQSIQSQIVAKAVSLLNTAGAALPSPIQAYRSQVEAFEPEQLPAWNVIPIEDVPDYQGSMCGAVDWKFNFSVRNMVAARNQADLAADALFVASSKAILADPTLGGLVRYTRFTSKKWERDGFASQDNIALVVNYEVEFGTLQTDPTIAVP